MAGVVDQATASALAQLALKVAAVGQPLVTELLLAALAVSRFGLFALWGGENEGEK